MLIRDPAEVAEATNLIGARTLKVVEPVVEHLPLVNAVGCAVYVFAAVRDETRR